MSYIQFDKTKLINLEYSLSRELIRSNRSGAYGSTTIISCNTRKYHGLLVVPQPGLDDELHILLSSFDETIIQNDAEFNLGLRKYPGGNWQPKGHKYIRDFESDPIPTVIYRVGGVVLKRESLLATNADQILLRYTLLDAHSPTSLRFSPFLLFRSRHELSKANIFADSNYIPEKNGISMRLYSGYSSLVMQFSKEPLYVHFPNWYYNIEYIKEQERGYDYSEDQFVPGYFELPIAKGETIVFSASTKATPPDKLKAFFNREISQRIPRNSFLNCLKNSAQQFLVQKCNSTEVIAGFPWYGRSGRDTFISLPGLTLETGNMRLFRSVVSTMILEMKGPLFPNRGYRKMVTYDSVDTSLWFFWAIQQYTKHTSDWSGAWKLWGKAMEQVLEGYLSGTSFNIRVNDLGLIEAGDKATALTWMDSMVDSNPVTPRYGMAVEVNALWYNALCYFSFLAGKNNNDILSDRYLELSYLTKPKFIELFWDSRRRCLYDNVDGNNKDDTVRPNQIIAASLPYSMLSDEQIRMVIDNVRSVLLTPRGLRTLSPHHPDYKGDFSGDYAQRDASMHQGAAYPWLSAHFAEAWLRIYGAEGLSYVEDIFYSFEETMKEDGLGTISEIYEGNPPHRAGGAISQARNVAELLRIYGLISRYK